VRRDADRAILASVAPTGVVVTDDLAIVEFRGEIAPYLEPAPGAATLDLLRMAREELRLTLKRAIDDARITGKPARREGVAMGTGGRQRTIDVEVIPFHSMPAGTRLFAVLVTEHAAPLRAEALAPSPDAARLAVEESLRRELTSTREYLQSVIEQLEAGNEELRAANEEIVSSNEELQSTNEELQTAKEELQATNEELRTVNDEMLDRNVEATRLADDLTNVLSSAAIPIVILGRDSRVRRFTPAATKTLDLSAADIGRPITETAARVHLPEVPALVADVLQNLAPLERTVQTEDGRWYRLAVRPYRTLDNRIDGTILSVYDIDALKKAELIQAQDRLTRNEAGFRHMLTSATEAIVMSEPGGRLVFANDAAARIFGYAQGEMLGLQVDDLLPARLREAHARHREGYVASPTPRRMGTGRDLLALRKDGTEFAVEVALSPMEGSEGRLLVAFITDITVRKDAERKIEDYQAKLQRMVFEAALTEERERRRLAQDLHDRIGQSLALARMKLEGVRGAGAADVQIAISASVDLLAAAIEDARTLTFELAPPVLYDLGLTPALSWLCEDLERRTGVHIEVAGDDVRAPFDDATAALVFRAVRELLTNVFKHAKARSARVVLGRQGEHFGIVVEDGGAGFDVEKAAHGRNIGFGLFSVREQIARLGGTVDIESAPQRGTRVSLRVPIVRDAPVPDSHQGERNENPPGR
jgi:two-component system CheB/CheR fusion protein